MRPVQSSLTITRLIMKLTNKENLENTDFLMDFMDYLDIIDNQINETYSS